MAFTEEQNEKIRNDLICEARHCGITIGMRKTSVEQLTNAAGISKGSFYKFFDSKAFPVFMIFTYTSFDCVDHRPTTFNFCILSRFSSSEACTYRSNVIVTEACPNISDNDLTSNPTSTARVANVWRSV